MACNKRWVDVAVVAGLALVAACSSSAHPAAKGELETTPTTHATAAEKDLRAAAIAWSQAYLTGTPQELLNLEGPECLLPTTSTTLLARIADFLQGERKLIEQEIGRPVGQVHILGVLVRNVTSTRGEAEVQYDLPASAAGNDNWVTYVLHDGKFKVADCRSPIGGDSASKSTATLAP